MPQKRKGNRQNAVSGVRSRAALAGLNALAMTFVLPHENKPMRLPVVPATLTALLDTMSDDTWPILDSTSRKAFLTRDPAYPLWVERKVGGVSNHLQYDSVDLWPEKNQPVFLPPPLYIKTFTNSPSLDGRAISASQAADLFVLGEAPKTPAVFIPPGAMLSAWCVVSTIPTFSTLTATLMYYSMGEELTATIELTASGSVYLFLGQPGGTVASYGALIDGVIPSGFTWISEVHSGGVNAPAQTFTGTFYFGWTIGNSPGTPDSTPVNMMTPFSMPPEFNNTTLPFIRSRLNSSAALFTNVTAALSKEGTVLAARLRSEDVDPWNFSASNLNAVHPSLRYFGPLEKGLYTFTTPSGNVDTFDDLVIPISSSSSYNSAYRPFCRFRDFGVYNAMIFADLGSSGSGSQMAVSSYTHLEFETTSSLFAPGVSTLTLETLHAAEVALLKFGHFHENPLHWAALKAAASSALRIVGPMVAPIIQQAGTALINKSVQYLSGKPSGDRTMPQASMSVPRKVPKKKRVVANTRSKR
jgi:hypothetical protein